MKKLAIDGGEPIRKKPLFKYLGGDAYDEEEIEAVKEILEAKSPFRYYGPKVLGKSEQFEREFAKFIGVKYALAVSSGTAGLHVALGAIGVGPGDEVILTPTSWLSDGTAVLYQRAVPVFSDIDFKTLNLDPEEIRKNITRKTKAILLVHYLGLPADMDEIMKIANECNLFVIEDSSLAHGAEYKEKKVGSIGHISAFSCQFHKILTSGEGGIITTNDDKLYESAYRFHDLGMFKHAKGDSPYLGYNYRITEIQSAILLAQLKKIDKITNILIDNAEYFIKGLKDIEELKPVSSPPDLKPVYYSIPIRVDWEKLNIGQEGFQKAMEKEGTPVGCINQPMYQLGVFKNHKGLSYKEGLCAQAESAFKEYITIGNSPGDTKKDMDDFLKALKKVIENRRK